MSETKRRRRSFRDEIPSDEFRNVTFRAEASVYNALARRAAETGSSVSAVLETLVLQHLLGTRPALLSLTAEDVRQIVREEMARRTSTYGGFGVTLGPQAQARLDGPVTWFVPAGPISDA